MAALWDIVGKASNLVQLFGLDAFMLIVIGMSFLSFHEVRKECRKLEDRVQVLQVLLHCPGGYWIMQQQQHLELWHLLTSALQDAHDLVESYRESTLFARVRWTRSLARQFRDLRNSIESYCGIVLSINSCLLIVQANPPPLLVARTDEGIGTIEPCHHRLDIPETSTAADHDTCVLNVAQE